jgi:hypothetical protein
MMKTTVLIRIPLQGNKSHGVLSGRILANESTKPAKLKVTSLQPEEMHLKAQFLCAKKVRFEKKNGTITTIVKNYKNCPSP